MPPHSPCARTHVYSRSPPTVCPSTARSLPTQLLCVFPRGPACERAVSRVRRAGLAAGHGVRAAGHTLYTAETAFRDQKSLRRHWPRLI